MTREEAIKVIKENESEYSPRIKEAIEVLTPELGESSEERIKRSLIDFLDDIWHLGRDAHFDRYTTDDCADWINWVKKQVKNNMGISEATKQKLEDSLNNSLEEETSETWNKFLEEQDEQEKETEQKDDIDMPLIEMSFGAKDSELVGATYYIPEGFHAEIEGNKVIFKQGEQQPAWSNEDEDIVKTVLYILHEAADNHNFDDWLKSLKERMIWRPTEEQMKALGDAIFDAEYDHRLTEMNGLLSLDKDLKKL